MTKNRIKAYKPSQVINKKRTIYEFEGKWKESFGCPERNAKWFITGPSFSGKSSLLYQLAAMLCDFGTVDYNSLEEGDSQTSADKMQKFGLFEKDDRFRLLHKVGIEDFTGRLKKRRSAAFAFIDSMQHAQMGKSEFLEFADTFGHPTRGKSLLFVSHWEKNRFTNLVRHDCDIKITVMNFVGYIESRYGGGKPFVIWEEKAKERWGKKYKQVIAGTYWPGIKR